MKVAYCSDLHLEFKDLVLTNNVGADVLVLAGDICVGESLKRFPFYNNDEGTGSIHEYNSQRYQKFFEQLAKEFKKVVYVVGNHEYYNGYWHKTIPAIRESLAAVDDKVFHVLENDCVKIDDVTFIGGTMWTDFDKGNEYTMYAVANGMNDYRVITYVRNDIYRKLRASDALFEHRRTRDYVNHVAKECDKAVVVTHHAPSHMSVAPEYIGHELNGGYVSDLSDLILNRPSIKAWVHGHVHSNFDYQIGDCRVLCNPRGYPGERKSEFELMTFEV